MKQKTIRQWFNSFREPYRSQAFADYARAPSYRGLDTVSRSAAQAVDWGITWNAAGHARKDWSEIHDKLELDPTYLDHEPDELTLEEA